MRSEPEPTPKQIYEHMYKKSSGSGLMEETMKYELPKGRLKKVERHAPPNPGRVAG
jgi:hypothetical protein